MSAQRSYHWVDRVSFIDETEERIYDGETTFTKFLEVEDAWHPMSKKQYDTMIAKHREENKEFYTKLEK
jgi:2-iminoacetate synthase ThiH